MQELERPLILVVAGPVHDVSQIVPVMEIVKKAQRPLLLFSEDLQPDPLSTLVYNNKKGIVQSCAINIPWMNGVQKEMLKDVAVMTGATVVDND
jgi:chaperonin GroEL